MLINSNCNEIEDIWEEAYTFSGKIEYIRVPIRLNLSENSLEKILYIKIIDIIDKNNWIINTKFKTCKINLS